MASRRCSVIHRSGPQRTQPATGHQAGAGICCDRGHQPAPYRLWEIRGTIRGPRDAVSEFTSRERTAPPRPERQGGQRRAYSRRRHRQEDPGGLKGAAVSTISPGAVTTAFELPNHRIVRNLGVVRGIVVRSRSIVGNIGAALQTLAGGNITLYTELCERARKDAFQLMLEHAAELGANAVVAVQYDANEVAAGVTEVLAYGTAVVVEPLSGTA